MFLTFPLNRIISCFLFFPFRLAACCTHDWTKRRPPPPPPPPPPLFLFPAKRRTKREKEGGREGRGELIFYCPSYGLTAERGDAREGGKFHKATFFLFLVWHTSFSKINSKMRSFSTITSENLHEPNRYLVFFPDHVTWNPSPLVLEPLWRLVSRRVLQDSHKTFFARFVVV